MGGLAPKKRLANVYGRRRCRSARGYRTYNWAGTPDTPSAAPVGWGHRAGYREALPHSTLSCEFGTDASLEGGAVMIKTGQPALAFG